MLQSKTMCSPTCADSEKSKLLVWDDSFFTKGAVKIRNNCENYKETSLSDRAYRYIPKLYFMLSMFCRSRKNGCHKKWFSNRHSHNSASNWNVKSVNQIWLLSIWISNGHFVIIKILYLTVIQLYLGYTHVWQYKW